MKILIGADIVPTKSNIEFFESGNIRELIDDNLYELMCNAKYRILNLEVPLTDNSTPIQKCGPNLIASTKSINGLKNMNIDLMTLANNHILDQGEQGLESTKDILNKNGINFSGVGVNLEEAAIPHIFEILDKKIGVYCCAEHEFSIATSRSSGANPFDPLESLEHISKLKKECDYVIVLYHGGKEQYRYPSPLLQKICRKIIDKGADIVICQHTHCIGCKEEWNKGTIVYGQGNFLFDNSDNEFWNTGLLISIDVAKNFTIEYIPIVKKGHSVALAVNEKNIILSDFFSRSNEVKNEEFILKEYEKVSEIQFEKYMNMLQGKRYKSILFRILNKISGYNLKPFLMKKTYDIQSISNLINLFDCEVHRESFLCTLNKINSSTKEAEETEHEKSKVRFKN